LPITLFALEGEDDFSERRLTAPPPWPGQDVFFVISTHAAELSLGKTVFDLGARPQSAAIADVRMRLRSPCLIQGDNGQGKSLLAKALSGAIKTRGHIALNGEHGSARLLFQDVINQTLLRSFGSLTKSIGRGGRAGLRNMFNQILGDYHAILGDAPERDADDFNARLPSLLLIKIMLTAVRLCDRPNALILDEPDWGLTRRSAEALVQAVVRCAHGAAVPVLLISHKPWWHDLVRSCIRVEKCMRAAGSDDPRLFTILPTSDTEN
jgi:energy-coupling factor transporter ATP-binding protein EcfA2